MTKQFSMSWSHWYRSIWWSYCTNFSLGNFSILLLLSNYQLDTDVSHILWLMFLCVPRCIITWQVRIFHTWKLKVELDLCYCGKEVKLLLWISWTILSCKFLRKLCLSMARNQTKKNTETIGLLLCNCSTWISCESLSYDMYYMRTCFHECRHSTHRSNWANSSVSASIRHWNRNRESLITKNEK